MSVPEQKALIETDGAELPVSAQVKLLGLKMFMTYFSEIVSVALLDFEQQKKRFTTDR